MSGLFGASSSNVWQSLNTPQRRKIFVSYHHAGDQWYYNEFSRIFHDQWETVFDNSLERQFDSDNTQYVMQRIRDQHITGTSCTVVLIGNQTHQRKYVDWEIKATLDKRHGLVGIILPTHQVNANGSIIVPDRFAANAQTHYAKWLHWQQLTTIHLKQTIEAAVSAPKMLISNSFAMKSRNG